MIVLGVDPGLRECGVAALEDGQLVAIGTLHGLTKKRDGLAWLEMAREAVRFCEDHGLWPDQVVAEKMVVRGRGRVNPDDLIQLVGVAGAIIGAMDVRASTPVPSVWKGQLKKRIHHQRILSKLEPDEVEVLPFDVRDYIEQCRQTRRLDHPDNHAVDALGLARWWWAEHGP